MVSLNLRFIYPYFNFTVDKHSSQRVYRFDNYRLDGTHLMLYRGDQEVPLPPKAAATLLALIMRRGEILSKKELMDAIWADAIVEESNLAKYLHMLRQTLGKRPDGTPFIETFRRRGYRFNGYVQIVESPFPPGAVTPAMTPSGFTTQRQLTSHGNVLKFVDRGEPELRTPDILSQNKPGAKAAVAWSTIKLASAAAVALILISALFYFRSAFAPGAGDAKSKNEITILRLTNGGAPLDATISPKSDYFVYHEQDGETAHMWLQQTGQSKRVEIISPMNGQLGAKTFSPDGQEVYFVALREPENSLYRVPTLGGTPSKVLDVIDSPVSFSPDGKQIVFKRTNHETLESSIVVADSLGGGERTLLMWPKELGYLGAPAWSPDGKTVAYSATTTGGVTINGVDVESGGVEGLSPEIWGNCYRIGWLRDRSGLIFIGTKYGEGYSTRRDQVYYLSLSSGESRRLTTDGNRHQTDSLGITANGEILAVPFSRSSQIWSMEPSGDSRTAVQITSGAADGRAGLAVLTDRRIVYTARIGDDLSIWSADSDGQRATQLTYGPMTAEEVRTGGNGGFAVFSGSTEGGSHLFRIDANGENLRQLTFGEGADVDSTISPDGNWIIYASQIGQLTYAKTVLRKIPAFGGDPVVLADLNCQSPHFSPDGRLISCILDDRKIGVISADSGAIVGSFDFVQTPYFNCGVKWSPDGRDLIYIARRKNISNLWRQPVNGGEPKVLTDFTSGDIYNFAFSTDGSRLYLARGYDVRDVVLITKFR